jgi:NTP pyrophosphatase (non-canonical NTP hydrolase)
MSNFDQLRNDVLVWANQKNLLKFENHKNQALKMVSEIGELCDAIVKGDKPQVIDGIGDSLVTIIILAEQLDLDPTNCLQSAYDVIKARTGKTVDGTFIKD